MTEPKNVLGQPDHGEPAATGVLSSLPWRTFLQGIALDLVLAICFIVYEAMQAQEPQWRLLLLSLVKTVLMTLASSIMRYFRPPVSP